MGKIKYACCAVAASFIFPLILSEVAGGWTRKWMFPSVSFTFDQIGNLTGKTAVVTGSNSGIGYVTARELAKKGARVIVCARTAAKGDLAVAQIKEAVGDTVNAEMVKTIAPLELSDLNSVRSWAEAFLHSGLTLDILVLNAGIMKSPFPGTAEGFELTEQGFESHIGVNHLAHHYLTNLLRDKLVESAPARVVVVSSGAEGISYEEGIAFNQWTSDLNYDDGKAYGQSKLANVLFARELAKRLEGTGVTAYSVHPGIVISNLGRHMAEKMFSKLDSPIGVLSAISFSILMPMFYCAQMSTDDGALTQLYLATDPTVVERPGSNGNYFTPIGRMGGLQHPQADPLVNERLASDLWAASEREIEKVLI